MKKILIVDDSRTSRKILRSIIEEMGLEVCGEAVDGEQGIAMYKELKPDVVTLDITMPVCDGVSALRSILEFDPEAKAIMVTAAGQQANIVDSLKIGAYEFVTKPFDNEVIKDVLNKAVM